MPEKGLFLHFTCDSTLGPMILHLNGRMEAAASIVADLEMIKYEADASKMPFNRCEGHILTLFLQTDLLCWSATWWGLVFWTCGSYHLLRPLLGRRHDSFKASGRLDILHHATSFLSHDEFFTANKAFVCSSMEYCSPPLGGYLDFTPHILGCCGIIVLNIIGVSREEA